MKYTLESAEVRHKQYPESFNLLPLLDRQSLYPDDAASLIFVEDNHSERMWVLVEKVTKTQYIGKLMNVPAFLWNIKIGEDVVFSPEHICDIRWSSK
jgi:hypothetical protein